MSLYVSYSAPSLSLIVFHISHKCITVTMVQATFTYRVWILSKKNRIVTSVLFAQASLTFCQFSTGIGMSILQQLDGDVSRLHSLISNAFGTAEFGITILCDILIAASMAYYLNQRRSGIRRTENLLDKLIIAVAMVVFVTWLAIPDKLIFMTFHGIICKLYVNSLLAKFSAVPENTPRNYVNILRKYRTV
ncbi:hypothetical protein ONZ45_g18172 [Pleurotus djamor]|nr:hypothetical protein ONZ45_g18172 [Pleurotus djamor]